jgi:hypothetical protein
MWQFNDSRGVAQVPEPLSPRRRNCVAQVPEPRPRNVAELPEPQWKASTEPIQAVGTDAVRVLCPPANAPFSAVAVLQTQYRCDLRFRALLRGWDSNPQPTD